MVLVHGGPGSYDHSYFKPDFSRLTRVAQVVYLDLRGHGRSEWGDPGDWSFEQCADDVRAFCDTLGIPRPIVYGHSMGGWIVMTSSPGESGTPEVGLRGMALLRELDVLDQVSRIDRPTLVCVGELEAGTPVAASREIADALPEGIGRLEIIAGAGHFTWLDDPDTYWAMLEEFVRETTA